MNAPRPSGWHYTWIFSGIGTMILSIVVGIFLSHKSADGPPDRVTPTPPGISTKTQENTPPPRPTSTIATVEHSPSVTESDTELEAKRRRAEERKEEDARAERQRVQEQQEQQLREERRRLEERKAEELRREQERLEREKEEIRRREEREKEEAAHTWHLARVRNRARVAVNYSVLGDAGQWQQYTVAPGATAGHGRHGDVIIEFDRGGGRGTNRLTLNSSTVHAARPSKADQDSAPASYFGTRSDGSLIISPR